MKQLGERLIQAANEAREIIQRPAVQEALRLKNWAEEAPIGKKRSSFEMYRLLADCMALAVQCRAHREDREALINLLRPATRSNPRDRKGQVNSTSSDFQLVCRFVFQHKGSSAKADRSNASRYGKALEEADRRQIGPGHLEGFLRTQGGVNALFLSRPTKRASVRSKTLYLTESVEIPKDGTITLKLRRNPDGSLTVMERGYDPPRHENDG